jgi:diphthamide biosynthesis methyltransferase
MLRFLLLQETNRSCVHATRLLTGGDSVVGTTISQLRKEATVRGT